MELLGRRGVAVQSIAASAIRDTSFVSLDSTGAVTLWDLRLRKKDYCTIDNPNPTLGAEANEVDYFADCHTVLVVAQHTLQVFDTRKTMQLVADWRHPQQHDNEWCAVLQGTPAPHAHTTLVVDEGGAMFGFDVTHVAPVTTLPCDVLGEEVTLPTEEVSAWGSLGDLCSGLGVVALSSAKDTIQHALFAVDMSGNGALYAAQDPLRRHGFTINNIGNSVLQEEKKMNSGGSSNALQQVINPPFVTCCACQRDSSRVAVGRGDGMYDIVDIIHNTNNSEGWDVELCMSAPGHAMNGLCAVDWLTAEVLLTTSLCGEVTAWGIGAFLACEEEEEEDLPAVCAAAHYRDVTAMKATMNCSTRLSTQRSIGSTPRYVAGDTAGNVLLYNVELA